MIVTRGAGITLAIWGMAAAGTAAAQDAAPAAPDRATGRPIISAALTAGTLGIGPDVGVRFSDHVGARANAMFLGLNADVTVDDNEYQARLKLKSYGAMVDVYPFGGSFRISGGARINRNRAALSGDFRSEISVEVDDVSYTGAQVGVLSGRARVKKFAPALTLGWGGSNRRGFMFGFEAGALFQGAVRIRQFTATGSLRNDPAFQTRLEAERRNVQDDVNDYKVYPIIQTMIGWRF